MIAHRKQRMRDRHTRAIEELTRLENALEIGLIETFPASDAIAAIQPCRRHVGIPAEPAPARDAGSDNREDDA
jgi:hypothetical protein